MPMPLHDAIAARIAESTGSPFAVAREHRLSGGCINSATRLDGADGRRYFVKLNDAAREEMFAVEAAGLRELARARGIRVPTPVCHGIADNAAYLVLEYIEPGRAVRSSMELLGRQLARVHRFTGERFGWHRDNTIGSTPQPNAPSSSWVEFWRTQRLGFQLELAARRGHRGKLQRKGEELLTRLDALLGGHAPAASLLHGDLWSGNLMIDRDGNPVLIDPAVYYGDREADLAMTELFGGFSQSFYAAYRDAYPLDDGYALRKTLYNLYHVINHLNLFGGGYGAQAEAMIETLLRAVR